MIGERLRTLRKRGMRQKELVDILGVNKSMISLYKYDKNAPTNSTKVKIIRCFGIFVYFLGVIDTCSIFANCQIMLTNLQIWYILT